jgi:hypothetical protein
MVLLLLMPLWLISFSYFLNSVYTFLILIFLRISFLIKPKSSNCFLNSELGTNISLLIKLLSFSISFKYLPKYNSLIS